MTDKITLLSDSDHEYTENTEDSKQSEEEKKTNTSTKIKPKIKSKNNMIHVVGISFDNIKLTMPENADQKTPSLFLCTFPRQYIGPLPQEFACDANNGGFCYFSKEIENIYQLTGCNLDCVLLSPGEHLDCVQILLNDTILIALMTDINRDKNLFQGKIDEIKIDKFKGDFGPWPENMSLSGEMNIYSNTFAIEEYKNSLKYYNGCLKPEISKTVLMDKSKTSVFFDINNLQYATADKSDNPWLRLYTLQSTNDSYCNVQEIGTNKYQCMESDNESYHTFELQHEIDSKQNDDQQYLAVIELPENFDKETWVAESPLWWISFKDIENMRDIKLFRGYYSSCWVKKADEFEIEWCGNNKVINIWKDEWTVNNLNINVLLSKENLKDITTINEEWKEQHYHVQQKVVLLLFTSKTKDIPSKNMKFCVKWTHSAYGKINRYEKWCNRNREVFLEINGYLHSSNLSEVDIPDSILDDLIKPEFNADINEIYLLNNLVCEGIDLYYNEYYENGFYFLLKEWKNHKLNGVQYSGKNMSLTLKLLVRKLLLENLLNGQDEEFNIFRSYYIAKTPTKFAFAVLSLIVSFLFSIALSWDVYNEFELDNISDDALILILSIFIFFVISWLSYSTILAFHEFYEKAAYLFEIPWFFIIADFISNVIIPIVISIVSLLLLSISDSYLDVVLNSFALTFVMEIDDMLNVFGFDIDELIHTELHAFCQVVKKDQIVRKIEYSWKEILYLVSSPFAILYAAKDACQSFFQFFIKKEHTKSYSHFKFN